MLVWFTTMNPISTSLVDWITASHLLQYMSLSGVMSIENIGSLFYLMMIWMLLNTWTMTMILKTWTVTMIWKIPMSYSLGQMKCIHLEGMSFWQTLKKISSVSFLNVEKNDCPARNSEWHKKKKFVILKRITTRITCHLQKKKWVQHFRMSWNEKWYSQGIFLKKLPKLLALHTYSYKYTWKLRFRHSACFKYVDSVKYALKYVFIVDYVHAEEIPLFFLIKYI